MSDQAGPERGYRRLLACYPQAFRHENEDEIIGVLLATAAEGQRRVRLGEAVDLLRGALRARLRPPKPQPGTVRTAVRLMCAGAVVELAVPITVLLTEGSVRSAILARYPELTAAQWHAIVLTQFMPDVFLAPVGVTLWLWMAWAHSRGHFWARVVFTVSFGLTSLSLLFALAGDAAVYAPADLAAGVAVWMVGAAAMLLIFNRRSAPYFPPKPRPRAIRVQTTGR